MAEDSEMIEIKEDPDNLAKGYEWKTCDLSSDETCEEVCKFLSVHFNEVAGKTITTNYSVEFLRWALCPPGYYNDWHVGVLDTVKKELVAFISGVQENVSVMGDGTLTAKISHFCIHKDLRSTGLAAVMVKELTRRLRSEYVCQAVYAAEVPYKLPTSPMATFSIWMRKLDPRKLVNVGLATVGGMMTMSRSIKLNQLPNATVTTGFRKMEEFCKDTNCFCVID